MLMYTPTLNFYVNVVLADGTLKKVFVGDAPADNDETDENSPRPAIESKFYYLDKGPFGDPGEDPFE